MIIYEPLPGTGFPDYYKSGAENLLLHSRNMIWGYRRLFWSAPESFDYDSDMVGSHDAHRFFGAVLNVLDLTVDTT